MSYQSDMNTSKRLILNEITNFLDKISDKKSIDKNDIDEFYLTINSHGMVMDAEIKILAPMAELTESYYITLYNLSDENEMATKNLATQPINDLKSGYVIQVRVFEISISPARRMMYTTMGYDNGGYDQTMASYIGR